MKTSLAVPLFIRIPKNVVLLCACGGDTEKSSGESCLRQFTVKDRIEDDQDRVMLML